jgi:8-oxo-dGTP pyrophosphatase MutT (NUDIX family)
MVRPPVTPRPSAVLTLVRETGGRPMALFMVRRHARSPFMPDVFVFPGGTVQAADREAERTPSLCAPVADAMPALGDGYRVAAIRECFEEAGVLLAYRAGAPLAIPSADAVRFAGYRAALHQGSTDLAAIAGREGLVLATDALLHWAHWITPVGLPRRFDTHFFLAAMPESQQAEHDRRETTEGLWIPAEEALARQESGSFPLGFPTIRQLRALTGLTGMAAARERFGGKPVRPILPTLNASGREQLEEDG